MKAGRILMVGWALAAGAISACGRGSSNGNQATVAATGRAPTPADARRAAALVADAFAPNPAADSGHISGTIGISVTGVPHFHLPISLTMVGRYTNLPGYALAEWDELLGVEVHGLDYGAGATSSHGKVYLNIGSTAFAVPQSAVDLMVATAKVGHNGLMKLLGGFGLRPQTWVRAPVIVGNDQIGGVGVVHLTFGLNPAAMFSDAAHFTQLLTALGVSALANLPRAISPAAQAALVRSVTSAHGDTWLGTSDHVVRRAHMALALRVPRAYRHELGGMTGATVEIELDVTEVGAPQTIRVQRDQQTWAQAIPLLNAAAFSNRPPGQRGE